MNLINSKQYRFQEWWDALGEKKRDSHLCSQVLTVGQHLLQGSNRETLSKDKATYRQVWWDILLEIKGQQ